MGLLTSLAKIEEGALSKAAFWAPWAGVLAYAVGKVGEERSRLYNRRMYGRDEADLGWSLLKTGGPLLSAAVLLGAGGGMFRRTFPARKIERLGAATAKSVRQGARGVPAAAKPVSKSTIGATARFLGRTVKAPLLLPKRRPGWSLFIGTTAASAYAYSTIPQYPRVVVPVDNMRAARARLQRSTDAVPFNLYYNRRRSTFGR